MHICFFFTSWLFCLSRASCSLRSLTCFSHSRFVVILDPFFNSRFLFFVNLFFCSKCSFAILGFHLQLCVVGIIIDNIVNIVNIIDLLLQLSVVGSLLPGVNGVSAAILVLYIFYTYFLFLVQLEMFRYSTYLILLLIDFCTPSLAWNLITGLQFMVLHPHHPNQGNHHHHHHHQPDVRVADQGGSNPARLRPRRSSTSRSTKGESVVRVVEVLGHF